jgi:glycosyltransferase involved in cell wall biosynthesis
MRILFVAFEFPPLGGAGVRRSMTFSKYLPDWGVTPIVVTLDAKSYPGVLTNPLDPSLLGELRTDLIVERIPCFPGNARARGRFATWRRIFFSMTEPLGRWWAPQLEQHLPRILERWKPEAVYVSLPPFAMGKQWCDLAERHGLPVILDFRDAWSQLLFGPYPTFFHYHLAVRLEGKCLQRADRVICSSERTRADLLRVHPQVDPNKIKIITNGFDVTVNDWSMHRQPSVGRAEFTIGYVGHFYYDPASHEAMMRPWWKKAPHRMLQYAPRRVDWLYRSPFFFFQAVEQLLIERPELQDRLRIRFAGRKPHWIDAQVNAFGLTEVVEFVGHLDHASVVAFQSECDSLLVTSAKIFGAPDYSIAGKTFEYFTMQKPILGFVTEGAQRDILQASGMAVLCDPDDAVESAGKLGELIDGKVSLRPNGPFLQQLHGRELSRDLADVLLALKQEKAMANIEDVS